MTTVITTVLGLSLATAGPAAALERGTWRPFGNVNPISATSDTSRWRCAGSEPLASRVEAQVCAIVSRRDTSLVQAAVIVHNRSAELFPVVAEADLSTSSRFIESWLCPSSGVGANSWSVCFGRTITEPSPVSSSGDANGIFLGESPFV